MFTVAFGALNAALVYNLLPRAAQAAGVVVTRPARLALTALFAFGTPHWWLAVLGQVWFTAQILGATCLLLALRETFGSRRPIAAASWLALGVACRPNVAFAAPAILWWLKEGRPWRELALAVVPFVVVGGTWGVFNHVRFGAPWDFGYAYMDSGPLVTPWFHRYGQFNLRFVPRNVYYAFLALPELRRQWPPVRMNLWGMSMFAATPALVYAFRVPWRSAIVRISTLGALLIAIPVFLYYNTGYGQAGYRYLLDFLPFVMILIAIGMKGRLTPASTVLIAASIVMGYLCLENFTHPAVMSDDLMFPLCG